jgi:hypothetical protein
VDSPACSLSELTGLDAVLRCLAATPHPLVHQLDDPQSVVLFSTSPLLREPVRAE